MGRLLAFRKPAEAQPAKRVASDARLDLAVPSDARSDTVGPAGGGPDPDLERRRKLKQRAVRFTLALAIGGGFAASIFGSHGWLDVRRSRAELRAIAEETDAVRARVEALRGEVSRLRSDPSTLERIAREDLGFSLPGEITFVLPREEDRVPGSPLRLPPPARKPGSAGAVDARE